MYCTRPALVSNSQVEALRVDGKTGNLGTLENYIVHSIQVHVTQCVPRREYPEVKWIAIVNVCHYEPLLEMG